MSAGQNQINWSMWEAIGTILASIIALFGWIWAEYVKPWRNSPKLTLELGEGLPFLASDCTPPGGSPPTGCWLCWGDTMRFRLCNTRKSKGTAYNVQVRAMGIYDAQGVLLKGFDPTTLTWSATQAPETYPLLSPLDYEYLDLLWLPRDPPPRLEVKNSQTYLVPGEYYFKLVVYAENARPKTRNIQLSFGFINDPQHPESNNQLPYYSVQFVKRIPKPRSS